MKEKLIQADPHQAAGARARRDEYRIEIGHSWSQVLCALFGHDLGRWHTWYSNGWECTRCGISFEHRWDNIEQDGR